ncbi:PrsW family glutamic-type intramembrane protease [Streptomyces sp. NPDC005761]|uniref:PrsW family glutamic-type intramembrane protease n=1 Tax=Streptomyces sp. NPDC005761 TaxID=3157066 RepID=UPI0033D31BD2
MAVLMAAAALWGALQLFTLAWPTRSVRLSTLLLALMVGIYGCGTATALIEVAYTRLYADQSGHPLTEIVNTTSYTVAPWVEELLKLSPLLLAGLYAKVRRQWGLTDFVVLGSAVGAGFGLLEALLRFGGEAKRAIPRPGGGWVIPDGFSPPYVPGLSQVLTSWLPAPFATVEMGQASASATFSHLVWTAMAALGVGVLLRGRGWQRLLSAVPIGGAVAYHTLNNYAAQHSESTDALRWLETLDAKAWMMPLLCLAAAMLVDLRRLHRGKRLIPGILLATERRDGDSAAALVRYAAWRPPWTLLIALRFIRLRRALCYASTLPPPAEDPHPASRQVPPAAPLRHPTAHPPSGATEDLGRLTARIAARIDASDHADAWKDLDIRGLLRQARARAGRRRWLLLIPCLLALPSLVFLGIGSFHSQADLQHYISTGPRPRILLYCAMAALAWSACLLAALLRTWRATAAQPTGEHLALHRFRITTALGSATTGTYLLRRGFDNADPTGTLTSTAHLLEALNQAAFWIGLLLLLISLAALFPPGAGLAMAGGGAMAGGIATAGITAEAAMNAALLGSAGIVLMAAGSQGSGWGETTSSGSSGKGSGSTGRRGKWRAREDIEGPAAGKELRFPHSRHTVSGSGTGTPKAKNSVIMRGHEGEVAQDIEGIATGRAAWNKILSRYEINGRTYGIEGNGTIFPAGGPNIVNLNRVEYGALKQIVRARGDISAAPQLARDPNFVRNPEAIEKALKIYNGIIP